MPEVIFKHFPQISTIQRKQFSQMGALYTEWNRKINVISRKDIGSLYTHHVLHSLAIAKIINFAKGTNMVDVGTGGGFPGIPLAILFPNCHFTLVDSIGKKVTVASEIAASLELENVTALKCRAEEMTTQFDFVLTRAVAPLPTIKQWTRRAIRPGGYNPLANGIIALKGGDRQQEMAQMGRNAMKWKISNFFPQEYFDEKYVIHIPIF